MPGFKRANRGLKGSRFASVMRWRESREALEDMPFMGTPLGKPEVGGRVLGAHLAFTKRQTKGTHWERLDAAVARARRVKWLPLLFHEREEIISAAVVPKGLYGALSTTIPAKKLAGLG